jgi:outer membrane lipoprotein-sorting protein
MFDHIVYGKRILIVLWLTVAACGCASSVPVLSLPSLSPEQTLKRVSEAITPDDRIVATARMDVVTAQGNYPLRTALVLQKPSYLRLELLPVIGTPDFFLAATPGEMKIFVPSRAEFYVGKPTAAHMGHFFPWTLNIEDVVMIFSGAYPPLAGNKLSYEIHTEDSLARVSMFNPVGESQTVWVENNARIVKLVRRDASGREIYSVLYEDYQPASRLAGKITILMADSVTSLTVKYTDVTIEKETDPAAFQLPVPAGMKIIHLN